MSSSSLSSSSTPPREASLDAPTGQEATPEGVEHHRDVPDHDLRYPDFPHQDLQHQDLQHVELQARELSTVDAILGAWEEAARPSSDADADPSPYSHILRSLASRYAREEQRAIEERAAAASLLQELFELPRELRSLTVSADSRYATYAVADQLTALGGWGDGSLPELDPEEAAETLRLALAVAESLDERRYGVGLVADLKARVWARLGAAWRLLGQRSSAAEAFRLAGEYLLRGTGDPVEQGEVLTLSADLAMDQGDLEVAQERLDRAGALFLEADHLPALGETLILRSRLAHLTGDPRRAESLAEEGLTLLTGHTSALRLAQIHLDRCHLCEEAGELEEAWQRLSLARACLDQTHPRALQGAAPELRPGPPRSSRPQDRFQFRVAWTEGRLDAALGLDQTAAEQLSSARDGLAECGLGEDAVLAHLDLGTVVARCAPSEDPASRQAMLERYVREITALMTRTDLSRASVMALLQVRQAAEQGWLTADLTRALARYLSRSKGRWSG